MGNEQINNI